MGHWRPIILITQAAGKRQAEKKLRLPKLLEKWINTDMITQAAKKNSIGEDLMVQTARNPKEKQFR